VSHSKTRLKSLANIISLHYTTSFGDRFKVRSSSLSAKVEKKQIRKSNQICRNHPKREANSSHSTYGTQCRPIRAWDKRI